MNVQMAVFVLFTVNHRVRIRTPLVPWVYLSLKFTVQAPCAVHFTKKYCKKQKTIKLNQQFRKAFKQIICGAQHFKKGGSGARASL